MSDPSLAQRLREHLTATDLLRGPADVVLAVSGGPDSLALLSLLAAVADDFELRLSVAHADHGIHEDSAAVAARVEAAAARLGVPCVVGLLALGAAATETAAREKRYAFLRRVQAERGARYLATAHHADDQAETVLLRLLRGTGTVGLAGIPARGPDGLVRPLLPFRRAELAAHAAASGPAPFDDPANRDRRHTRAWVRHVVLPELRERLGAAADEALLSTAAHAHADLVAWNAVLDVLPGLVTAVSEGCCEVARDVLTGYHKLLAARVLRAAANRAGLQLGPGAASRAIRFAVAAKSGRRIMLGDGLQAEMSFGVLRLSRAPEPPPPVAIDGPVGRARFGAWRVTWAVDVAPARLERTGPVTWLQPGVVPTVRAGVPGDSLVPLGGVGHRRVSRLLMEARVPRSERRVYPVLAVDGAPVWVPDVCRGAGHQPAPGTPSLRVHVGRD